MIKTLTLYLSIILIFFTNAIANAADNESLPSSKGFDLAVDAKGGIRVPAIDYRKDWVALGTWSVDNDATATENEDPEGAKGLHIVYTQPEAIESYRRTGKFPDGTILIKELFKTTTEAMTTGTISRAAETEGFFVMVKDSKNRFPDNKLWGLGWGWAFFKANDTQKTTTKDHVAECKTCHIPAEKTDWVYIQGYPVLKK